MHRKPAFSLAYAHDIFKPAMSEAFPVLRDIPDIMRAVLETLDRPTRVENPQAVRLAAIKALSEAEALATSKACAHH